MPNHATKWDDNKQSKSMQKGNKSNLALDVDGPEFCDFQVFPQACACLQSSILITIVDKLLSTMFYDELNRLFDGLEHELFC